MYKVTILFHSEGIYLCPEDVLQFSNLEEVTLDCIFPSFLPFVPLCTCIWKYSLDTWCTTGIWGWWNGEYWECVTCSQDRISFLPWAYFFPMRQDLVGTTWELGGGFEQPGPVRGVPVHSREVRTRWALRWLLTQAILWYFGSKITLVTPTVRGTRYLCEYCFQNSIFLEYIF